MPIKVPVIPAESVQSPLATLVRTTFETAPWAVPILRGQNKRSGAGLSATLPGSPSAPLASTIVGNHSSDGELRIEVIEGTPRRATGGGGGRLGRSSLSDPDNDKYGKNRGQSSSSSGWPSYVYSFMNKGTRLY
jgi:hypothetical protein